MRKFFTITDPVVPMHHPRVLLETAMAQGADRQALLEGVDIPAGFFSSADARISYFQFSLLARNALRLTNNPALGLDVGRNIHLPQLGVLGLAVMSSPTVGAALDTVLRHYQLVVPAWEIDFRIAGERAVLSLRESIPLYPFEVLTTEITLVAFDTQSRFISGGALPKPKVRVKYPMPAHVARYPEFFATPVLFDQKVTELEFDARLLEAPVVFADPATATLAERYCTEHASLEASANGLVLQVRRLLNAAAGPPPALDAIARTLQTSSRTLRRTLEEMGTSYSKLVDDSRRALAEEWVHSTEMTFEQIAQRLGFSDVRSFRRAFKRWTGATPSNFRARAS